MSNPTKNVLTCTISTLYPSHFFRNTINLVLLGEKKCHLIDCKENFYIGYNIMIFKDMCQFSFDKNTQCDAIDIDESCLM